MPTILVTGSSGKTSSRLAKLLHQSGHSYLIASRKGTAPAPHADKAVKFDWADASTYNNPFAAASDISAVWLVAPETGIDPSALTKFIDLAVERKVKRFVLLSATLVEPGGPFVGKVHEYLIQLGKSKGIEWTVLRPTWFMENFTEAWHKYTLASEGAIYSATGEGRLPFVSCDDIAAMAYHGLVDQPAHNRDFFVLGPKTVSYDEVVVQLSKAMGKPIVHKKITESELATMMKDAGMPAEVVDPLAAMEATIAHGAEDRLDDAVLRVTGRPPKSMETYIEENKASFGKV